MKVDFKCLLKFYEYSSMTLPFSLLSVTAKYDMNIYDLKQKDLINTLIACVSVGKFFNNIIFVSIHYSHDIQLLEEEENRDFLE